MKLRLILMSALFLSLGLTACNQNDVKDNVATRNSNTTEPTRVKYNIPNHGGPAISGVDVSDIRLDQQNAKRLNNGVANVRNSMNPTRMKVADEAANKIADLPGVAGANVVVTDKIAYVAAKLDNTTNNKLTNQVKKQISKTVKNVDKDIDRVYISVNPDFYDRLNSYATDLRNGKPVSGLADEFTKTIQRVFPEAK